MQVHAPVKFFVRLLVASLIAMLEVLGQPSDLRVCHQQWTCNERKEEALTFLYEETRRKEGEKARLWRRRRIVLAAAEN